MLLLDMFMNINLSQFLTRRLTNTPHIHAFLLMAPLSSGTVQRSCVHQSSQLQGKANAAFS